MAGWLAALGAAGLVFAARLHEIHAHAGTTPFLDQWKVEGAEILAPWLDGSLGLGDFFRTHNEHLPVWTRLLAWLEAVVTGRWDPRVQMAVNAALHAGFVGLVARWLQAALPRFAALAATALLVVAGALPFSWENSTWGFQSQFPLALLGLFLHVHGSLVHPPYSARWWWAQAAGFAGLFTLGGMWTAPLVVVAVGAWTGAGRRRAWLAPLACTGLGLLLMFWLRSLPAPAHLDALHATGPRVFLHAWLVQLGWPAGSVLINLPLVILALQLRGRRDAAAFDRIVLALGAWAVLQGAAIAYARGGGYAGYVSRYGDLLAVGLLANFLATLRLVPAPSLPRWLPVAFSVAWLVPAAHGLYTISTTAHTYYFHERSATRSAVRRDAVLAYVRDGDVGHLARPEVRDLLYPDANEVARLLSLPGFRELLPDVSGPSATGRLVRQLETRWAFVAALGGLALAAAWFVPRRPQPLVPPPVLAPDPWRMRLVAGVALAAFGGLLLWPRPLVFGEIRRKQAIVERKGTIAPLDYAFQTATPYAPGRTIGAAGIAPGEIRNIFRGTHFSGPEDQAVIRSDPFVVVTPRLIVPFAGQPAAPGIALQLVVEDDHGGGRQTYPCPEAAPVDVGFWEIDTSASQGRKARFVLTDQSDTAWIAAAAPQYAWVPGEAEKRRIAWDFEQTAPAHEALGWICLLSLLACAWAGLRIVLPRF